MFSDELKKISWDETTRKIASKTELDVRRALAKEHCDVEDFMALISPAAEPYLEQMARLSQKYTRERFGKTMSMFIPLYITNSCSNSCVYCGFHRENPMARTILTIDQCEDEYKAIKRLGPFENLLIVTGENPAKAGVDYLAKALDRALSYNTVRTDPVDPVVPLAGIVGAILGIRYQRAVTHRHHLLFRLSILPEFPAWSLRPLP